MEEQLLKTFARSVTGYFDTLTQTPVQLGTPFLGERGENLAMDFSAIIGISGAFRGNVFYTAPRGKLQAILPLLGEAEPDDQLCAELVGEMTNTISGNVRDELGSSFMISTPMLLGGTNEPMRTDPDAPLYILPFQWQGHSSRVLLSLIKVEERSAE
jgi:chemotaxis protein CheX